MAPYLLLVFVTGRYLFIVILLEISAGYGTPFLKVRGYHTYLATTTSSTPSIGSLSSQKACPPQDSDRVIGVINWRWSWPKYTKPTMDPDQIFATDVGIGPVILSVCHSSLPCICNQSQLMLAPTKYMQQTSGIPLSPSGFDPLCWQAPKIIPTLPTESTAVQTISNWRRGSLKYRQPTSGLSNPGP